MTRHPKKWAYKNTMLLAVSIVLFLLLLDTPVAHALIAEIRGYGYLGAVITGVFFVSTFTVAPASVVLYHLAQDYNPLLIALTAGFGSMLGDLLIFRFFKDQIFREIGPLIPHIRHRPLLTLFKSRHFRWLTPVLGAIIIALPFAPDEVGVGMMGVSKITQWQFMLLTYVLDTAGILLIVLAAQA